MQKILAKELGRGNIRLSTRLWGILTTHEFDMGNPGVIEAAMKMDRKDFLEKT